MSQSGLYGSGYWLHLDDEVGRAGTVLGRFNSDGCYVCPPLASSLRSGNREGEEPFFLAVIPSL